MFKVLRFPDTIIVSRTIFANVKYSVEMNRPKGKYRFPLIVKNLPRSITWGTLKDLMREAGDVRSANIVEEINGKTNTGIVYFSDVEGCNNAISMFDNNEVEGRKLSVSLSTTEVVSNRIKQTVQPLPPLPPLPPSKLSSRLIVDNLNMRVSWQDLKDYMGSSGAKVRSVTLEPSEKVFQLPNSTQTRPLNKAVVIFNTVQDATKALNELRGTVLRGNVLEMNYDTVQHLDIAPGIIKPVSRNISTNTSPTIFVYNLSYSTKWQDLKDHFRLCGDVLTADVSRDADGKEKGVGFVKYATVEEANRALVQMHGTLLNGRAVYVRELLDKPQVDEANRLKLYIDNIPINVGGMELKDLISSVIGFELYEVLMRNDVHGSLRQQALVTFNSPEDAEVALKRLQNLVIRDKKLVVKQYTDRWE